MPALEQGMQAPAFRLPGQDNGPLGPGFERLTLLVFYKVTCPVCQMAMPYLERFGALAEHGLDVRCVAEDPEPAVRAFQDQHGGRFPTYAEPPPYPVSSDYGLTNVPTVFLVEPGGQVARTQVGFSKDGYNALAAEAARRLDTTPVEICPPNDDAPAFRPG